MATLRLALAGTSIGISCRRHRAYRPPRARPHARSGTSLGGGGGVRTEELLRDLPLDGLVWPTAATAARAPAAAAALFRREADYWVIGYDARRFRLRDTKGLGYMVELLRRPRSEVHVLELCRPPAGGEASGNEPVDGGDAGPILDERARESYRRRVAELKAELDEATRFNDPERAAGIRAEIEALTEELTAAFGLGGRERRAGGAAERARQTVTKAIKSALANIRRCDAALGHHLALTIKTGAFCCYEPGPVELITWLL